MWNQISGQMNGQLDEWSNRKERETVLSSHLIDANMYMVQLA